MVAIILVIELFGEIEVILLLLSLFNDSYEIVRYRNFVIILVNHEIEVLCKMITIVTVMLFTNSEKYMRNVNEYI
jgi:hypothetical protein